MHFKARYSQCMTQGRLISYCKEPHSFSDCEIHVVSESQTLIGRYYTYYSLLLYRVPELAQMSTVNENGMNVIKVQCNLLDTVYNVLYFILSDSLATRDCIKLIDCAKLFELYGIWNGLAECIENLIYCSNLVSTLHRNSFHKYMCWLKP